MNRRKFLQQERLRLVVVREADGSSREHVISSSAQRIVKPVWAGYALGGRPRFGQIVYEWNGRDSTVSGLPVFR